MKTFKKQISAKEVFNILGKSVDNYDNIENIRYDNIANLIDANKNSICFYENEKYKNDFLNTKAGFVFVRTGDFQSPPPRSGDFQSPPPSSSDFQSPPPRSGDFQSPPPRSGDFQSPPSRNGDFQSPPLLLPVDKPYYTFMTLVSWWLSEEAKHQEKSISPQASIHPSAQIGNNVHIAPFATIEENVVIADNTNIGASSVIMKDTKIGKNCKIYPNVVIYENCQIGEAVIIHSGAVIGADGFGFIEISGKQIKIPHVGKVIIENDVEIGANTCIDRATLGTTVIKTNTKIDNLVQVAHNCEIGESSVLCSQVGLAGSSIIGNKVYLAGQVGVAGHLTIEDNSMIGAQSGVASSLKSGRYFGSPALPAFEQMKIVASLKQLPALIKKKP